MQITGLTAEQINQCMKKWPSIHKILPLEFAFQPASLGHLRVVELY